MEEKKDTVEMKPAVVLQAIFSEIQHSGHQAVVYGGGKNQCYDTGLVNTWLERLQKVIIHLQ
jgi:hypothetical protein